MLLLKVPLLLAARTGMASLREEKIHKDESYETRKE